MTQLFCLKWIKWLGGTVIICEGRPVGLCDFYISYSIYSFGRRFLWFLFINPKQLTIQTECSPAVSSWFCCSDSSHADFNSKHISERMARWIWKQVISWKMLGVPKTSFLLALPLPVSRKSFIFYFSYFASLVYSYQWHGRTRKKNYIHESKLNCMEKTLDYFGQVQPLESSECSQKLKSVHTGQIAVIRLCN